MKRSLTIIFIASLILAAALPSNADDTIHVGISAPFTGAGAEYGAAVKNGFEMAKAEQQALSRFRFFYDDNKYDAAESLSSYRKLRTGNKVDLIYLWGEPGFSSVAPAAEQDKFPLVAMSTDRSPGAGKKFIVRAANDSFSLASALAAHLVRRGVSNVDVVYTDDPFFTAFIAGLRNALPQSVKVTEAANVLPAAHDFRTIISRLNTRKPDSVAVFLMAGQARDFFRQAEQLNLSSYFFGTDVFESREEIRESGPKIQGAVYPIFDVPDDFRALYLSRYNGDSQISYGYIAYAFARTLPQIFPEAGPKSAPQIIERIKLLTSSKTGESFSFRENPDAGMYLEFPITMKAVRGEGVETLR